MHTIQCTLCAGEFYPQTSQSFTVHPINFDVAPHTWTALQGPSGLGKTTLLRYISGTLNPHHCGDTLRHTPPVHTDTLCFFMGAHAHLIPWYSVQDNITLCDRLSKHTISHDTLHRVLSIMEMEDVAQERPHSLSSGMTQRIALAHIFYTVLRARAMHPNRPIFLGLDEPFSHMDPKTKHRVISNLKSLDTSCAVMFITHSELEQCYAHTTYTLREIKPHTRAVVREG